MKILVERDDCRSMKNAFAQSSVLCDTRINNEIIEFFFYSCLKKYNQIYQI